MVHTDAGLGYYAEAGLEIDVLKSRVTARPAAPGARVSHPSGRLRVFDGVPYFGSHDRGLRSVVSPLVVKHEAFIRADMQPGAATDERCDAYTAAVRETALVVFVLVNQVHLCSVNYIHETRRFRHS